MQKLFSPRNLLLIVVVLGVMIGGTVLLPVPLPTILLPAESLFSIGGFNVTNTIIATLLADVTIIALALLINRRLKEIPTGIQNLVEAFLEIFQNMTQDIAGKVNAKRWFPLFMTILVFLMIANWWELAPGFDSVGIIEPIEDVVAHTNGTVRSGYKINLVLGGIPSLTKEPVVLTQDQVAEILAEHKDEPAKSQESHVAEDVTEKSGGFHESKYGGYVLKPFLRAAATDLNVPLALAIISVLVTQIEGIRALGFSYFRKFFLPSITGIKAVDAFVGILELISEVAKIVSFSFRLFGNIFAGQVLLFVMPFLVTFFLPLPFYGLELFVGFMQAFVFAILTILFLSQAVVSHAGHHDHESPEGAHA